MKKDGPEKLPLEKEIQKQICEYLSFNSYFFWRQNNVPIFGKSMDGQFRHRAMSKFSKKGIPDIIVIHNGKFIGLEVKREGHLPLSDDQEQFKKGVEVAGGKFYKVSSLEDVLNVKELF